MTTPAEIDTAIAAEWTKLYAAQDRRSLIVSTIKQYAGAKYYYRGRQRVTDMTTDEAVGIVTARAEYVETYKASHVKVEDGWTGTDWSEFEGAPYDADKYALYLAKLAEADATCQALLATIRELEAQYTGWSRFFLVTSSAGHVHSSTCCSTCYITTRYGWLPELSGKDEVAAVGELGPTLCTVCFPSAPTEYTIGKKITAAQAAKRAA